MCKRQIEAFLPFLEHRTSQNTISIPKNQTLQSLSSSFSGQGMDSAAQFNHIDPWTVLEDWDDCPLVPSLFGAISVQRRALTYASAYFRSEEEGPVIARVSPSATRRKEGEKGGEGGGGTGGADMEVENETTEMDVDTDNPVEGKLNEEEEEETNFMEEEEGEVNLVSLTAASTVVVQKVVATTSRNLSNKLN